MAKKKTDTGLISASNTFEDGLITDMHAMSLPASAMSDAINMEFVTTEADQYVLQNMKGSELEASLPPGYEPLAVKEYQNIAYIVAGKFEKDGTFIEGMVGTYPSPDWTKITPGTDVYEFDLPINKTTSDFNVVIRRMITTGASKLLRYSIGVIPAGTVLVQRCGHDGKTRSYYRTRNDLYSPYGISGERNDCHDDHSDIVDIVADKTLFIDQLESESLLEKVDISAVGEALDLSHEHIPMTIDLGASLNLDYEFTHTEVAVTVSIDPGSVKVSRAEIVLRYGSEIHRKSLALNKGYIIGGDVVLPILAYNKYTDMDLKVYLYPTDDIFKVVADDMRSLRTNADFRRVFDVIKLEEVTGSGGRNIEDVGIQAPDYCVTECASDCTNSGPLCDLCVLTCIGHIRKVTYFEQFINTMIKKPEEGSPGPAQDLIVFNRCMPYLATAYVDGVMTDLDGAMTVTSVKASATKTLSLGKSKLYPKFSPIYNYGAGGNYPMITDKFKFIRGRPMDMILTGSYDGSVDMIITDDINDIMLINSRFKFTDNQMAVLADRKGTADTNIYSDATWDKTRLLQDKPGIPTVSGPVVGNNGKLLGGGYRYYFRYSTQEGNTSDIIYESPFIPVSDGILGINEKQESGRDVTFEVTDTNIQYAFIKVYFEHHFGEYGNQILTYELDSLFDILPDKTCTIKHSGYEKASPVDPSAINIQLTAIDHAKSIAIVNNRLIIANTKSTINEEEENRLARMSLGVKMKVRTKKLEYDYSDPESTIDYLGYWRGEVYEFAIVYVLRRGGVSPAYPITGMDFMGSSGEDNNKGLMRSNVDGILYNKDKDGIKTPVAMYFEADTSAIANNGYIDDIAEGFFIVRRERLKNVLIQGLISPALQIPTSNRGSGVTKWGGGFFNEFRNTKALKKALDRDLTAEEEEIMVIKEDFPNLLDYMHSITLANWDGSTYKKAVPIYSTENSPPFKYPGVPEGVVTRVEYFPPYGDPSYSAIMHYYFVEVYDKLCRDAIPSSDRYNIYGTRIGYAYSIGGITTPFAMFEAHAHTGPAGRYYSYSLECIKSCLQKLDKSYTTKDLVSSALDADTDPLNWKQVSESYSYLGVVGTDKRMYLDITLEATGAVDTKFVPQVTQYLETVDYYGTVPAVNLPYDPNTSETISNVAFMSGDLETNAPNVFAQIQGSAGFLEVHENESGKPRTAKIFRDSVIEEDRKEAQIGGCHKDYKACMHEAQKRYDEAGRFFSGRKGHLKQDKRKCSASRHKCIRDAGTGNTMTKILTEEYGSTYIGKDIIYFEDVIMQPVMSGVNVPAPDAFSGMSDRDLSYRNNSSNDNYLKKRHFTHTQGDAGFSRGSVYKNGGSMYYVPKAAIYQKYSTYIGVRLGSDISFNFSSGTYQNISDQEKVENRISGVDAGMYSGDMVGNIGKMASLYNSPGGRWDEEDIEGIYKKRENSPYYAVTERFSITKKTIDVFRGDGFVTRSFKRYTYKAGVGIELATEVDAGLYGTGTRAAIEYGDDKDGKDDLEALSGFEKDDRGQGLHNLGQVIELISQTNTNADIRSKERVSSLDSAAYGGDRTFYPLESAKTLRGDARPDSSAYNHGYTGHVGVLPYMARVDAPVTLREFPNRVVASAPNVTSEFYNSFRDVRGFNHRDYGVEFGDIEKLVGFDGVVLTIHRDGVLAVGIDDRTMVGEGSEVYIDSVKALSTKPGEVSSQFGTQHQNSVIRVGPIVVGVDYARSVIWMFDGKALKNISEFAVKAVILEFKESILNLGGEPKLFTTFDATRHVIIFSFGSMDKYGEMTNVGSLIYSNLLKRWVTKYSDGTRFLFDVQSRIFSFGIIKPNEIWESHVNDNRSQFRGIDYDYGFEIVVNDTPQSKKILDNITLLTNKVIPTEIVYTISNEEADAADSVWDKNKTSKTTSQKVVTRGIGNGRMGIINQNAYYKNSNLYIEVSKTGASSRKVESKKRVADKYIKIKIMYSGNEPTFIQAMLSTLRISYG